MTSVSPRFYGPPKVFSDKFLVPNDVVLAEYI